MSDLLRRQFSAAHFRRNLIILWVLLSAILIGIAWTSILARALPDPDDHMRLQQVRDLLAGQSWFDTRQYRINPPAGAPMHWSRLVDIPLAGMMLLLRPLLGNGPAELATMTIVPLITFGFVLWLTAHLVRRFVGHLYALAAVVLLPTFTLVWIQIEPLRIDHHGWQLVAALSAISAVFHRQQRASGFLAGLAIVAWLAISIEGLPFAAAIGSLFAIRWAVTGEGGVRLETYLWTLAGVAFLALGALPPGDWTSVHCDALTLPYVAAFAAAGAGASLARRVPLPRAGRFTALGGIAGLAIIALGLSAPVCLNGPFAALDPLVRKYWYMGVPEGLPIWEQTPTIAALVIGFPLIGLAGAAWGWFRAADEERGDWASLIYLAAGSIAVAMMLQRGGALANVLALPGALYLISRALPAARRIANAPVRLAATVAVVLLLSPWTLPMIGLLFEPPPTAAEQAIAPQREGGRKCSSLANLAKLNVLPPANLLTPLDIAPLLLTATHHRLVASGHHRNQAAMHDVIAAFIGSPGEARRIIEARRIEYVVVCPYQNEPIMFGEVAPQGFWSSISKGRHPDWLEPVDLGDLQSLRIWRVRR